MTTRRTLLLAAAGALVAPTAIGQLRRQSYGRERRQAYEALVEALLDHGSLPGAPSEAGASADRLSVLYAESLPGRRREIDAVLDELRRAELAHRPNDERIEVLRRWSTAGGEPRARAARAVALAAATFGPADRALTVVI